LGVPPSPYRPDLPEPLEPLGDRPPAGWTPVWVLGPPSPRTAWQRWGRHLLLFVLTVASVFLTGALKTVVVPSHETILALDVAQGVRLATGLLGILLAHEMGHYLACRYYGVDATLPFFLPAPFLTMVGTLGAFIRIRARIPDRRALFDIGVAGPLAGFIVCLPVLWLGIHEATIIPTDPNAGGIFLGEPLLFQWVTRLVHGPLSDAQTLNLGPLGLAAWFGLFVTALNLIPIGQLDGGHVTYALLRERARRISQIGWWVCIALAYFGPNWLVWAAVLRVLGRRHPSTMDDWAPVGRARAVVGLLSLAVFVVCFVPDPIIWSWRDFFEATGLAHLFRR
jgi:membrane-associated protease RseP (regulator of RpoE activity)